MIGNGVLENERVEGRRLNCNGLYKEMRTFKERNMKIAMSLN